MDVKLSQFENLELEERKMHMDNQKKFYELDIHERKQETIRRGLETLMKVVLLPKNVTSEQDILKAAWEKMNLFLGKLEPHKD